MPDLDRELERFGRWLDNEIAERGETAPLEPVATVGRHRSRRLAIAVGTAAALAVAMLAVASRHDGRQPSGGTDSLAPDSGTRVGPDTAVVGDPSAVVSTTVATGTTATAGAIYVVRSGDTFAGIARQLGFTYEQLVLANPGVDPNQFLLVGQRLQVPTPLDPPAAVRDSPYVPPPYVLPSARTGFQVAVSPVDAFSVLPNVVLIGRPTGPDSWRDLIRVTASPDSLKRSAPPAASGFDGTGACDCVVGMQHGVQVVVEGAVVQDDALAFYTAVTVDDSASISFGDLPGGFVEIARTRTGTTGASATLTMASSTVTVETWEASTAVAVADLPVRPAGVLTRTGEVWRLVSAATDVTVQSVVPGLATRIAVPVDLASQRDGLVESLTPVSAEEWSRLAANTAGTYTVVAGDTVDTVLAKLGITLEQLLLANPRLDPSKLLVPGQRLRLAAG